MALDRFIQWQRSAPDKKEIEKVLRNYIGEAGIITWKIDRWFIVLSGQSSSSFKGLEGYEYKSAAIDEKRERYFEVIANDKYLDVITRLADEFTNAVAQGFTEICARLWNGILEI